jgi:hypothetical protein
VPGLGTVAPCTLSTPGRDPWDLVSIITYCIIITSIASLLRHYSSDYNVWWNSLLHQHYCFSRLSQYKVPQAPPLQVGVWALEGHGSWPTNSRNEKASLRDADQASGERWGCGLSARVPGRASTAFTTQIQSPTDSPCQSSILDGLHQSFYLSPLPTAGFKFTK